MPSVMADLVKMDLEAIVAEQLGVALASASPTTGPSEKGPSMKGVPAKRKNNALVVLTDSSDIEIMETTSFIQKRKRDSPPLPGSEEFTALPAVNITSPTGKAVYGRLSRDASPKFGSQVNAPTSSSRPKRARKMTEKARASMNQENITDSESESAPLKKVTKVLPAEFSAVRFVDEAMPATPPRYIKTDVTTTSSPSSPPWDYTSDNEPSHNILPDIVVDKGKNLPNSDESDDAAVADTSSADNPSECNDVEQVPLVMLDPCPDLALARLYDGLPELPRLCEIRSFQGTVDSLRTPFNEKCAGLGVEVVKRLVDALKFTKSGNYINTAKIAPSLLYVDNNRLRVSETKALAVCIMTGTVTESFLVASAEAGPRHSPYSIHKVTIAPFEQDFRRDVSLWGLKFDFHVISGMISSLGFGFATRGEGKGDAFRPTSAPSSPAKPKTSVLKTVYSPLIAVSADAGYGASRSFDDPVPIYDGRPRRGKPAFSFSDADFKKLTSWPLYCGGGVELPLDALVSVGYTLSMYKGNSGPVLSSNIQFVILVADG